MQIPQHTSQCPSKIYCHATTLPYKYVAMQVYCHAIILPCNYIAIQIYCHAIILPCNYIAMHHCCTGTRCAKLLESAYSDLKDINLYDILWTCYHGSRPRQEASAQVRASPQGRSWPLGGWVRPGVVPTWSDLLGAELGHVPPCLDSR